MNIVIFGAPGSGKGTQSALLIEEYGYYHISTGDVLRAQIAQGTELGKIADSYISKGQLIPDELMIDILDDVLSAHPESAKGVVFDGFPRTIHQADALDVLLEKRGGKLDIVVGLEVEEEELIERLINRGKTSGRSDDNMETIKKRLDVYNNQTNPLRDHYMEQGKYEAVHGMGSIEDIFANIKSVVEKHRSL
ncbi:MAG: adenylate kinase [Bacteroidaceae bacterium]|nr:adenylate kinase [Bacteroidaceae bacterium]